MGCSVDYNPHLFACNILGIEDHSRVHLVLPASVFSNSLFEGVYKKTTLFGRGRNVLNF